MKTNISYDIGNGYRVIVSDLEQSADLINQFQEIFFGRSDLDFQTVANIDSYKKWQSQVGTQREDCYRLLPYKIKINDLACIVTHNHIPVHISFCKFFDEYLRVCVGYNTLVEHRNKIPVTAWRKDWGYFQHLLQISGLQGHFVTYHNRTSKISAESRMLRQNKNRSGLLGMPKSYLSDFAVLSDDIEFYGVQQTIAFRHISGITTQDNYNMFLKTIQSHE